VVSVFGYEKSVFFRCDRLCHSRYLVVVASNVQSFRPGPSWRDGAIDALAVRMWFATSDQRRDTVLLDYRDCLNRAMTLEV
jgi:hypothetical protein